MSITWGRRIVGALISLFCAGPITAGEIVELQVTFDPTTGRLEGMASHGAITFTKQIPLADSHSFDAMPDAALASPDGSYLPPQAWWPTLGHNGVDYRYRLTLTVPLGQVAVATAHLDSEPFTAAGYRATFVGEIPPLIFVGPYEVTERWHTGKRLRTYFPSEMSSLGQRYLDRVVSYIDRFEADIGDYPHSHFWVVSAPFPVGLGFSGATYVSERILPLPFMQGRSLAHEVLHNWWGNGVRADYATGNWSEGLTTYLADYGLAEEAGETAAHNMRLAWLRDISALRDNDDTALSAFVQRHHDAAQVVGYDKVAMVFHMLRRKIGDAAFDNGLKDLWKRWRGNVAGWSDLRRVFESASSRELGRFFEQWITRAGTPDLTLQNVAVEEGPSGWRLALRLRQDGRPWDLTVPVVVKTAEGTVVRFAELSTTTGDYAWDLSSRPIAVAIDPDHHVLRRLATGEAPAIFRDVTLDGGAAVVVAGDDTELAAVAEVMAAHLLGRKAKIRPETALTSLLDGQGIVLIGLDGTIEEILVGNGISIPDFASVEGTARAWATQLTNGQAVLVIAANDRAALEAIIRPLPHYGSHSYVVFDGRRAINKGTLPPAPEHPLSIVFD